MDEVEDSKNFPKKQQMGRQGDYYEEVGLDVKACTEIANNCLEPLFQKSGTMERGFIKTNLKKLLTYTNSENVLVSRLTHMPISEESMKEIDKDCLQLFLPKQDIAYFMDDFIGIKSGGGDGTKATIVRFDDKNQIIPESEMPIQKCVLILKGNFKIDSSIIKEGPNEGKKFPTYKLSMDDNFYSSLSSIGRTVTLNSSKIRKVFIHFLGEKPENDEKKIIPIDEFTSSNIECFVVLQPTKLNFSTKQDYIIGNPLRIIYGKPIENFNV